MFDIRDLIRSLALQVLYEIDSTGHDKDHVLAARVNVDIRTVDAPIQGYLALLTYADRSIPLPPLRIFELPLNKPADKRTPIEQVLIDYLTEGIAEDTIDDDMLAVIQHEIVLPQVDEFDLKLSSSDDLLNAEEIQTLYGRVNSVLTYQPKLDAVIKEYATEYPLDQMAVVDRNVLRLAILEMAILQMPVPVVINEAIELGKIFGSESSPRFINGVLGAIAKNIPDVQLAMQAEAIEE